MAKIFIYIGMIFITVASICLIEYLYSSDNYELQFAQEMAQNVSQNEISKEEISKIEEKKFTNKIIIYSLIGILVFIVIVGAAFFYCKIKMKNLKRLFFLQNKW